MHPGHRGGGYGSSPAARLFFFFPLPLSLAFLALTALTPPLLSSQHTLPPPPPKRSSPDKFLPGAQDPKPKELEKRDAFPTEIRVPFPPTSPLYALPPPPARGSKTIPHFFLGVDFPSLDPPARGRARRVAGVCFFFGRRPGGDEVQAGAGDRGGAAWGGAANKMDQGTTNGRANVATARIVRSSIQFWNFFFFFPAISCWLKHFLVHSVLITPPFRHAWWCTYRACILYKVGRNSLAPRCVVA